MTCTRVRRRLAAHLDDELPVADRISVDGHLRECRACADIAEEGRALSAAVRQAAEGSLDEGVAERLRARGNMVLSRVAAEREVARATGIRRLVENPHLLWVAGATCAVTVVCVLAVASVVSSVRRPDSLAAVMVALSNPGSNQNPLGLRSGMVTPQLSPDAGLLSGAEPMPLPGRPTGVTFSVVLTQEGTVSGLAVLGSRGPEPESWVDLVGSAAEARFQPAEYRGAPVAVNMVWVVEQVTIQGEVASDLSSVPRAPAA